jgi:hypothetical protein
MTPDMSNNRESHLWTGMTWLSKILANKAVVNILAWYVTWSFMQVKQNIIHFESEYDLTAANYIID